MVKEQNYGYSFSPFRFVLIHPLRFARPPVPGGQLANAASLLAKHLSVYSVPLRQGDEERSDGGGG